MSALKTSWGEDAPFASIDVTGLGNSATGMFTAFSEYVNTL